MKRTVAALVALFVVALAVRHGVTWKFQGLSAPPKAEANPDQVDYEWFAYQMSIGHGYAFAADTPTACRPPGTSFTMLPIYLLFGHSYLAARLWFCFLSSLTVLVTAWVGTLLFGKRVGFFAGALLAVYPGHFYYAMHFLSEVPFALFLLLACGCGIVAARRGPGWADVLCGLAWGFTVLIRPNMLIGLALQVLVSMSHGSWKTRLTRGILLGGMALAVIVPWVVRNDQVMGKPTLCTIVGGYTFWGAHNEVVAAKPEVIGYWVSASSLRDAEHPLAGTEVEREEAAYRYGWDFIRNHPDALPHIGLHKLLRLFWAYDETSNTVVDWLFRLSWLLLAPLVMIGAWQTYQRRTPQSRVLLIPIVATVLTVLAFYGCSRFRDGIAPVLVIFAAVGVVQVLTVFGFGKRRRDI